MIGLTNDERCSIDSQSACGQKYDDVLG